ncbi:MAG: type III polyketide synthase [Burkholderiales bacterium]|nr:type III polyketide synthase [Bacteroidia bacterium]
MAYIVDIATAVPEFYIEKESIERFYSQVFGGTHPPSFFQKLRLLNEKTKIKSRYSCIPDYNGGRFELYEGGNYRQPTEKIMEVYKQKIMPLAAKAINALLKRNKVKTKDITHLITVSCTGMFAPGFEFLAAEQFDLQHTEKLAINFMGCYAALKAVKQANYIAEADPNACVLIICAELCSLHFYPSDIDEDIISNLLFADGAAATLVCGKNNKHIKDKVVLQIDAIGSACIPNTAELMTWNITSSAFRMYLSRHIVKAIKENIKPVLSDFTNGGLTDIDYWAIHPGGVKIVEAVRDKLGLTENNVADSMHVLKNYGNMSSPTILFILKEILSKIIMSGENSDKKIVSCAFGPGITIEMVGLTSVDTSILAEQITTKYHAIEIEV